LRTNQVPVVVDVDCGQHRMGICERRVQMQRHLGELDAQVDFVLRAVKTIERPHPISAKRATRKKK